MIVDKRLRQEVYDFYRSKLDKRYPKGYKIITYFNTKEFYLYLDKNSKTLSKMGLFLAHAKNIDGVNIDGGRGLFAINIGTASKGPAAKPKEINFDQLRKVEVDYRPLHTVVFKKTSQGPLITLDDSTAVIPDPSNNLSEFRWYLNLYNGYVNIDYSDIVSKDTVETFGDLMGQL